MVENLIESHTKPKPKNHMFCVVVKSITIEETNIYIKNEERIAN